MITVATSTNKATGQNQLNAVSETTAQSVPCSSWNMPEGFSRQSAIVTGTATSRPANSPKTAPKYQDRALINSFGMAIVRLAGLGQDLLSAIVSRGLLLSNAYRPLILLTGYRRGSTRSELFRNRSAFLETLDPVWDYLPRGFGAHKNVPANLNIRIAI